MCQNIVFVKVVCFGMELIAVINIILERFLAKYLFKNFLNFPKYRNLAIHLVVTTRFRVIRVKDCFVIRPQNFACEFIKYLSEYRRLISFFNYYSSCNSTYNFWSTSTLNCGNDFN